MRESRCPKCGSGLGRTALILGKKAFKKPCSHCGAELCPECEHRKDAHINYGCDITWDGAYTCGCTYYLKDNCEVCKGAKGGVRGNENVIDGVVTCDYCTAAILFGASDSGAH